MMRWMMIPLAALAIGAVAAAGCSSNSEPEATPTPQVPGAVDALGEWVQQNRSVAFVGLCSQAQQGVDVGKLCANQIGERGDMRAYALGPTFSDPTATAMVQKSGDQWTVVWVRNRDPSGPEVPGIPWPLEAGDRVVVVGLDDCLRIREQPTQQGNQLACVPQGTTAIVQEGPVEAETFTWWRIAGEGFNGWAAGTWLRLESEIARLFQQGATPTPPAEQSSS